MHERTIPAASLDPLETPARPRRALRRTSRLSAAFLLVWLLVAGCGEAAPGVIENEVLGVSIVNTSIGTTQVRSLGSGISVQLLETDQVGHSSIALARDGTIIVSSAIGEGEEIDLEVEEAGTYEVWAVTTGEAAEGDDGTFLAAPQRIDRIGSVTLGS